LFSHDFSRFSSVTGQSKVTDKNDKNPFDDNAVPAVTDRNGGLADTTHSEAPNSSSEPSEPCAERGAQSPFEVLGPAAPSQRCSLCGAGGPMRIKHGHEIDLWHPGCAERYFAAMADPPVHVPPWTDGQDDLSADHDPAPHEDRSCRQCGGALDGTEQLYHIDGKRMWLHPECREYLARPKPEDGPPE
jgi:hypothetical protein